MAYSIPLMALARGLLARQGLRGRVAPTAGVTLAAGAPAMLPFLPPRAEGDTGASTPLLMPQRGYEGDSPRERIAVTAANDILARQREAADSGLLDRANFQDENAIPNPNRPREAMGMPLPVPRPAALDQVAAPSPQSLWDKYNETGDAGDFVRADRAMMAARKAEEGEGKAKGGAVAGKDAALHKALEIIHHLLTRGR